MIYVTGDTHGNQILWDENYENFEKLNGYEISEWNEERFIVSEIM